MQGRRRTALYKANALIKQSTEVIEIARQELEGAGELVEGVGYTVKSSILDPTFGNNSHILRTTGGHSNTDHVVKVTGDTRKDRIDELKRAFHRRFRASQPEERGEDRWDGPKITGMRRRRIYREKDMPQAPPEPPPSGYVIFVMQMTTKIRHDRINEHHNQPRVVKEISKIWRFGIDDEERKYYNDFCEAARTEYQKFHREYRATGSYDGSGRRFERMEGVGPWVHTLWHEKNELERELATYDTVKFPLRPPEMDEAYERRKIESIKRRRLRVKAKSSSSRKRRKTSKTATITNNENDENLKAIDMEDATTSKESLGEETQLSEALETPDITNDNLAGPSTVAKQMATATVTEQPPNDQNDEIAQCLQDDAKPPASAKDDE